MMKRLALTIACVAAAVWAARCAPAEQPKGQEGAKSQVGGQVMGQLLEEATNKPATRIQVIAAPAAKDEQGRTTYSIALDHASMSDSEGRFHIKGIPPGTYALIGPWLQPLTTSDGKGEIQVVVKKAGDVFDLGKITVRSKR